MNGKKARILRNFAQSRTVGKPQVQYREKKVTKEVSFMGANGEMQATTVEKSTTFMDVGCTRKYYKMLKQLDKSGGEY